ncbi:MAG: SEC-C metal-binding domain-containing protein [Betaproteobacteria bacterium]
MTAASLPSAAGATRRRTEAASQRNEPCPCGSGRKYKL